MTPLIQNLISNMSDDSYRMGEKTTDDETVGPYFMRHSLILILTILFNVSYGQIFLYPSIKSNGQSIADFIPVGWSVLDSVYGDLNNDGLKDAAIILQHKHSVSLRNTSEDTVLTQPRMLLILFKNTDNSKFSLIEQSNSFILKHDNAVMDDPYQGIAIDKGVLKIDFHLFYSMGSWYSTNSTYKFRYDGKEFKLIGADISTIHRGTLDFEDYSYNFLTKKRRYSKGNEEKGTKKTTLKSFALTSFKTFKTFEEPYSWEIEADINL
jgi:hypothetical protein